jgi:hypothetical protein
LQDAYVAAALPSLPPLSPELPPEATAAREKTLKKALLATIDVSDEALKGLADTRALTVQSWLREQGKIDPERLFIVDESKLEDDTPKVRFTIE